MSFNRLFRLIPLLLCLSACLPPGFQPECHCETPPDRTDSIQGIPEFALEREMLIFTNQLRIRQGLQALTPDETLINIAREHSLGMAQQGFISHELPGNLKTRMSRGGYVYKIARENVASSRTVTNAQNSLENSPPHRVNILAADVDRIGIGIIRCSPPYKKELYITEIFASKPEQNHSSGIKEILLRRIKDLNQNGAGLLTPDPVLERLASDSARSLNLPVKKEELRNVLANSTSELGKYGKPEITGLDIAVQLLHDPKDLEIPGNERIGSKAGRFGTAVRQVVDNRNQPAFLVLTLVGYTK